ncbi:pollen receptor-like kinase 1 [Phoenix dactylifera]|uniref:Pollen receptor-like kinase 1 n=1 Tax=Phoenix dactylifera TaxID=42345 RepID=A0A8B7CL61_PHODC|nr:pollen receptor-like kinase 1 [Phoenix dactylifera]
MAARRSLPLLVALLFAAASLHTDAASLAEADVLLKFKTIITDPGGKLSSWIAGTDPCSDGKGNGKWGGVICSDGNLHGLQLENMGLSGMLNASVGALRKLPDLRTLSFRDNQFSGPMPDVKNSAGMRSIFLSNNKLSGEIPDDAFQGMGSLKKVDLSHNEFSGPIPTSLARVPKLLQLRLDDNNFSGTIPDLRQKELHLVNVSRNELEGKIPDGLKNVRDAFFDGNKNLCGEAVGNPCATPTPPQQPSPPAPLQRVPLAPAQQKASPSPTPPPQENSIPVLAVVTLIAFGGTIAIVGAIVVALNRRREEVEVLGQPIPSRNSNKYTSFQEEKLEKDALVKYDVGSASGRKAGMAAAAGGNDQGRLVFVRNGRERFELHDLLKSSAEVLGTGNFGCTYRATLPNGPSMVVKRFRDMNRTGREDFEEHMRRLGRLSHPNLLPLVAYYYRKEEKLLVHDYVPNRSLALMLHGNRGPNHPMMTLDWPARLKIVKGAASALAYLHEELPMLGVPHGHLKSSNVLLGESLEPLLTDYALIPVMNQAHAAQFMVSYKSPERKQIGRTSKKSDVWSLGMLMLEILTGKVPMHDAQQGKESTDLVNWANSVAKEEWAGQVLDSKMSRTKDAEGQILKLLQIALACCEENVEKRWELKEAVDKIEEMTQGDGDNSSTAAEGEVDSSKAGPEDDLSSIAIN